MPDSNSMLWWLAHVCRTERKRRTPKIKHVDISSATRKYLGESVDNSTISRFEQAKAWPHKSLDAIVGAYADELKMQPIDIWAEAVRLWREHLARVKVTEEAAAAASKPQPGNAAEPRQAGRGSHRAAG